ncbi:MAG: restriction endonuclease [Alistipes sp.]
MKLKIEYLFQLLKQYEDLYIDDCIFRSPEHYLKWKCSYEELKYILAHQIADNIIKDYIINTASKSFYDIYYRIDYASLAFGEWGFHLGIPYFKFAERNKALEDSYQYWANYYRKYSGNYRKYIEELNRLIENTPILYEKYESEFKALQDIKLAEAQKVESEYNQGRLNEYFRFILINSFYLFDFLCEPTIEYDELSQMLFVDYYLPSIEEIPNIKSRTKSGELKMLSPREVNQLYDDIIYKIIIRSIAEIFHFDSLDRVTKVCFNGRVKFRHPATGQMRDTLIASVIVDKNEFINNIDLNYIAAKECFKYFKGISGSRIHELSPIAPIIMFEKNDKRFVLSHNIDIDDSVNLAEIGWEDFEHLVREIFDLEFNTNGGEVKITQASRDGGVDAVAFDPDPIRGGKIVIQAKRYNNTVGVSAVRDLYGTIINEGANKGILITTSDYGPESYAFAKGKPITLLNGGHLLYLLEKHGKKARIEIKRSRNKRL